MYDTRHGSVTPGLLKWTSDCLHFSVNCSSASLTARSSPFCTTTKSFTGISIESRSRVNITELSNVATPRSGSVAFVGDAQSLTRYRLLLGFAALPRRPSFDERPCNEVPLSKGCVRFVLKIRTVGLCAFRLGGMGAATRPAITSTVCPRPDITVKTSGDKLSRRSS